MVTKKRGMKKVKDKLISKSYPFVTTVSIPYISLKHNVPMREVYLELKRNREKYRREYKKCFEFK